MTEKSITLLPLGGRNESTNETAPSKMGAALAGVAVMATPLAIIAAPLTPAMRFRRPFLMDSPNLGNFEGKVRV
ncbi:hypothetical protein GCM10009555_040420 [Acrocarpospora macrocephala]|uniref:Uncharacterized protein n=1 Tax=Acrocarpospora macrocephala TaxID=150177 RepID=A0A5M3WL47_9ACTN|nr:hypothetical protein Amac_035810 [Acrocarpospora macrocephala]